MLVTGDNHVAVPQNISAAVNYDCVNCLTYALATQLFVTLDGPLQDGSIRALNALWQEIADFGTRLTEVPLSEVRDRLTAYEQKILGIIEQDQGPLGQQPDATPTTGPTDGPSGAPRDAPSDAPSDEPSGEASPAATPSSDADPQAPAGEDPTARGGGPSPGADAPTDPSPRPTRPRSRPRRRHRVPDPRTTARRTPGHGPASCLRACSTIDISSGSSQTMARYSGPSERIWSAASRSRS